MGGKRSGVLKVTEHEAPFFALHRYHGSRCRKREAA
jgi:hypothetical protein